MQTIRKRQKIRGDKNKKQDMNQAEAQRQRTYETWKVKGKITA